MSASKTHASTDRAEQAVLLWSKDELPLLLEKRRLLAVEMDTCLRRIAAHASVLLAHGLPIPDEVRVICKVNE